MAYRVDNVPVFWRPFWLAYSWIVGIAMLLCLAFLNATCRIHIQGREHLESRDNVIYSLWHEFWFLWFIAFLWSHDRHVWMQHPAAYMKPIHIVLELMGVGALLGSAGEAGRAAADRLAEALAKGSSTTISPDGPHGPPGEVKKGVLHVAFKSGVPIVPVRFVASPALVLPTWDRKRFPLPFSTIRVIFEEPLVVAEDGVEDAAAILSARMTGYGSPGPQAESPRGRLQV